MNIIKLNATDSTNSFLRRMGQSLPLDDFTVVVAKYQSNGRGQMGTQWSSESGKNLMFSVYRKITDLRIDNSFYISMVAALSVYDAVMQLGLIQVKLKWPNDILADQKKIAGILIENILKQNDFRGTIIGVGLNVNQTDFNNLPKASSLRMLLGKTLDLDEVLDTILVKMQYYFSILEVGDFQKLKQAYEAKLYRKDKPSTFKDVEGNMFSGFIRGVSESGNLLVEVEDHIVKEFGLKQIQLLF